MKGTNINDTLEEVLNAYIAEASSPTHSALKQWTKRYPQYEKELIDFTVNWILMNELPSASDAESVDETTLVLRAMSVVQNRLHTLRTQSQKKKDKIAGLLTEGNRLGLSIQQMADYCELSVVIVKKLDQRLIDYKSIPAVVVNCIAKELRFAPPIVSEYLQLTATRAKGARYSARAAPKLPAERENFFDAIRSDPTLDEKRRIHWLALDPRSTK